MYLSRGNYGVKFLIGCHRLRHKHRWGLIMVAMQGPLITNEGVVGIILGRRCYVVTKKRGRYSFEGLKKEEFVKE